MEKREARELDSFDPRELPWVHGQAAVTAAILRQYLYAAYSEDQERWKEAAVYLQMARRVARTDPESFAEMADLAMRPL
jgi:hypothetical protein